MRIELLPQPELHCLIYRLIQNLDSGAGEHRKAQLCFDLDQNVCPAKDETPSVRRGMIQSIDEDAIRQGKPFVPGSASKEIFSLLTESVKLIDPLYWLKGTFERKNSDWVYEFKAQSCSEYKQLCLERKPLEDALEPLMLAGAQEVMPDWKELAITFERNSPKRNLRVIARAPKVGFKDATITDELKQTFNDLLTFYEQRDFLLKAFNMELLGGPKKRIREITDSYL